MYRADSNRIQPLRRRGRREKNTNRLRRCSKNVKREALSVKRNPDLEIMRPGDIKTWSLEEPENIYSQGLKVS